MTDSVRKKIIMLSNKLGYTTLLYWDPILTGIKRVFSEFKAFTVEPSKKCTTSDFETKQAIYSPTFLHDRKWLGYLTILPFPGFILRLRREKPDVIIINEFNLMSLYVVLAKLLLRNSKILLLVESDPFCGKDVKISRIHYKYRRFIAKRVDYILTNNAIGKKYLVDKLDLPENKVMAAPYMTSVPPGNYKLVGSKSVSASEKIKFLFVGQLIERKGIDFALQAFARLSPSVKSKVRFDIIGDGELRDQLTELAQKLDLTDVVTFHGHVNFSELEQYYKNAHCFVLPTRHDYRALVGFEAIAYQLPVIDSSHDGARSEIVEEGKNGYIVEPENIDDFSRILEQVVEHSGALPEFSKHSQMLSERFTPDKAVENICRAIKTCLEC